MCQPYNRCIWAVILNRYVRCGKHWLLIPSVTVFWGFVMIHTKEHICQDISHQKIFINTWLGQYIQRFSLTQHVCQALMYLFRNNSMEELVCVGYCVLQVPTDFYIVSKDSNWFNKNLSMTLWPSYWVYSEFIQYREEYKESWQWNSAQQWSFMLRIIKGMWGRF